MYKICSGGGGLSGGFCRGAYVREFLSCHPEKYSGSLHQYNGNFKNIPQDQGGYHLISIDSLRGMKHRLALDISRQYPTRLRRIAV